MRTEVAAGRWVAGGRHTVIVAANQPGPEGRWWQAVWETAPRAVLDGAAALVAWGLTGYDITTLDVSVPWTTTRWGQVAGVRVTRRRVMPELAPFGVPRVRAEWATIRAAQLARTDRQAALLVCLPVQQRLVAPDRLLGAWQQVRYSPRRAFLQLVITDVCDGARSMGELDFGRWCREYGIPPPHRQVPRITSRGRVYLDCTWDDVPLTVEIDGGHHALALNPLADALRENEIVLGSQMVLRIPVLGLRLQPAAFLHQVRRARQILAAAAA